MLLNYCLFVGIFKGSLVKFFAEKVARGNSVQIGPFFPAKSLSIYTKEKLTIYLINYLWLKIT